jgi:hypothetical protein
MEYLRGDRDRPLILGADNQGILMCYVDTSFAVHTIMCGHKGGGLTIGRGSLFSISVFTKQKLNTKSLTESELVGIDDLMPIILLTCYFLLSQGHGIIENLLLQYSKSSILFERNGNTSSGKCNRHINTCYFFITDQANMKELTIEWCPTKQMVDDFMTKTLKGSHFRHLGDYIMGRVCSSKSKMEAVNIDMKINNNKKKLTNRSKVNGNGRVKVVAQYFILLRHRSVLGYS